MQTSCWRYVPAYWKSHGQTVCDRVHCTPMDVLHRLTYLFVHYQWQELVFNFIKQMHHNVATVYELMNDSTGDKFTQCSIVGHIYITAVIWLITKK